MNNHLAIIFFFFPKNNLKKPHFKRWLDYSSRMYQYLVQSLSSFRRASINGRLDDERTKRIKRYASLVLASKRELCRENWVEKSRRKLDRSNVHDVIWPERCVVSVPVCFQPVADFSHASSTVGRRRANFQKSAVSAYGEKQKFPCPTCPSVFSHKNNLYYHAKFECGQMPRFNCPYCIYRTKHVSNVRAHVRRKHPGNNVYAIDVCKISDGWIIQCVFFF